MCMYSFFHFKTLLCIKLHEKCEVSYFARKKILRTHIWFPLFGVLYMKEINVIHVSYKFFTAPLTFSLQVDGIKAYKAVGDFNVDVFVAAILLLF